MLDPSWLHVISVNPLPQLITSDVALKCKAGDPVPYRFSGDKIIKCRLQDKIWQVDQGEPTCISTGGERIDLISIKSFVQVIRMQTQTIFGTARIDPSLNSRFISLKFTVLLHNTYCSGSR